MTSYHRRALLALATLLAATSCDSGTESGEERFTALMLSFNEGLAQPYYLGQPPVPGGTLVLTGDSARFSPYASRCIGIRIAGRVDEARTNCQYLPAPPSIRWSSSDPAVAEVDASGLARARGPGTVTIRAEADGYVTDFTTVGFASNELGASRTFQVRRVEAIAVGVDSAKREGCGTTPCPVPISVDPESRRLRMKPGEVFYFSVRQLIDTQGNDVLPQIDNRRIRYTWTSSGPSLAVSDGARSGEGRAVAKVPGQARLVVTAAGASGGVDTEVSQ